MNPRKQLVPVFAIFALLFVIAPATYSQSSEGSSIGRSAHLVPPTMKPLPVPQVTGPVAVTGISQPFMAANRVDPPVDLQSHAYVEEEYFLTGQADVYQFDDFGNLAVRVPNLPYTDRILVRKPVDKSHFSGSVYVEILNPATGSQAPIWDYSHNYFMAHGDAWIGVTSKPNMIDALKKINPVRYESLAWPSDSCGDSSPTPEYGILWDILTQISALVRSNAPHNLVGGLDVQKVYMLGKTGGDAPAYIISIHSLASLQYGRAIFDGYVVNSSFGSGQIALNQCAPRSGLVRTVPPRGVPIMNVQSETDIVALNGGWQNRRPDSDAFPDLYRLYEVPGSSHIDKDIDGPPVASDLAIINATPFAQMNCVEKVPLNPFPLHYVFDAVFSNLEQWTRHGVPPPRAERLEITVSGNPPKATPLLDRSGNALGGVRLPALDVPLAIYYPAKVGEDSFCGYAGYAVPFGKTQLKVLYPSHEDYVNKVRANVDRLSKGRWLTDDDAKEIVEDAQRADIP